MSTEKVGIFSGTFDPVHEGHLAFARAALARQGLDKVFFLVEPRPRRKQGVEAFEHRTAMVRLAISDESKFGNVVLEQQRFTPAETLPILTERFKGAELYMLMGDDWLAHFGSWPGVEELTKGVRFIIGIKQNSKAEIENQISFLHKTKGLTMWCQLIEVEQPNCSSSKIKQALRQGRIPQDLPLDVLQYIQREGLYVASVSGSK